MRSDRLKVALTRRLPDVVEKRLAQLFDVQFRKEDTQLTKQDIIDHMKDVDVLVPCISDVIDASMLAQAGKQLKLIANFGAGFDNIDVATALQRGILVSNTPDVVTEDTADMAMALMLSVTRQIPQGLTFMQSGRWDGWSPSAFLGSRLAGKRLGILGMGRIGRAIAVRAKAFGMKVHYHNRQRLHKNLEDQYDANYWVSLDQMVAHLDILSINCPHTPSTFHLMNARRLKLMKPDSVVINTSRGEVLDENALTNMLQSKEIAGAGLDVYERGREINPKLMKLQNVVLLPHISSATREGRLEMGEKVIINIKTFSDGHRPPDQVVPSML